MEVAWIDEFSDGGVRWHMAEATFKDAGFLQWSGRDKPPCPAVFGDQRNVDKSE
jgi:hypothetical protein